MKLKLQEQGEYLALVINDNRCCLLLSPTVAHFLGGALLDRARFMAAKVSGDPERAAIWEYEGVGEVVDEVEIRLR